MRPPASGCGATPEQVSMRDFKGMKRQRNRGRGGGGGGGGKPQHNANRAFDSNGPDGVKVRGAAQHIYEKYQQLARDASSSGDRVLAENYLQHAEHYFRVLRAMQPQRPVGEIIGRDQFASGYDIDFEEEPQAVEETAEAEADGGAEARRDDRGWQGDRGQGERNQGDRGQGDRDRQQGEYRQRDDRGQRDDYRPRDDRGQGDYRRDDRGQGERQQGDRQQQGDYRQGGDRYQGGRDRYQGDRDRYQGGDRRPDRDFRDRDRPDPLGVIEPQATPLTAAAAAPYEPPREDSAGVLRSEDGAMSHAPAFLQRPERA